MIYTIPHCILNVFCTKAVLHQNEPHSKCIVCPCFYRFEFQQRIYGLMIGLCSGVVCF